MSNPSEKINPNEKIHPTQTVAGDKHLSLHILRVKKDNNRSSNSSSRGRCLRVIVSLDCPSHNGTRRSAASEVTSAGAEVEGEATKRRVPGTVVETRQLNTHRKTEWCKIKRREQYGKWQKRLGRRNRENQRVEGTGRNLQRGWKSGERQKK